MNVEYEKNAYGDNIVIIPGEGNPHGHFTGMNPSVIDQGTAFDPAAGVKAYDKDGNEVEFTVTPTEINTCEIGNHILHYVAGDLKHERVLVVQAIPHPTIYGTTPLTVEVNQEFDPLEGVHAIDGNGNPVEVTVEAH